MLYLFISINYTNSINLLNTMITQHNNQSEEQLQAQCYQWFHNQYPALRGLLFHIPNGGNRSMREGAKFKAMGVVAGIPDMILCVPAMDNISVAYIYGLFIELKAMKGKTSEAQIKAHKRLNDAGYYVHTCNSFEAFKELIIGHISMSPYKHLLNAS